MDWSEVTHAYTSGIGGPRLHYVAAGPESGRPVVLLHGFPDFWYGWRHQIAPLAEAGYRVLVPDQRGYNLSTKPEGVRPYRIDELVTDTLRFADEVAPGQRLRLVGHDWGAFVAWWLALRHPERLERLSILNGPHPVAYGKHVRRSLSQTLKSWYVLAVQMPRLPEWYFARHDFRALTWALRRSAFPDTFSDSDVARYQEAWAQPGAITTMLNWYRAAVRFPPRPPRRWRVSVPTRILWGAHDVALDLALAETSRAMCDDGTLVVFDRASHWVQMDEPGEVNRHLLQFLAHGND